MNKSLVIAAVVSAAMIGASSAFCQEAAPSRPAATPGAGGLVSGYSSFVNPDPTLTLLRIREVQTELKLEEEKAKKLDEINAEITRERDRLYAEYSAKFNELNKKAEGRALGLLSEAQQRRTSQLRLQQQGERALVTTQVAEKVGLSQEQRAEISKIISQRGPLTLSGRDQGRNATPPNANVPAQDRIEQFREAATRRDTELREKIIAVLTPEQKTKWSELTGETFQFPSRPRPTTRGTGTRSSEPAKPETEKKDQ